jgi:hypothetical protein
MEIKMENGENKYKGDGPDTLEEENWVRKSLGSKPVISIHIGEKTHSWVLWSLKSFPEPCLILKIQVN